MSAVAIVISALKAAGSVTAITGSGGIYPMAALQGASLPHITVRLAYETTPEQLTGSAQWHEAQIVVECRANKASTVLDLGETVKAALRDQTEASLAGKTATILKDGPDFSDYSDDKTVFRRVLNFTVFWR